MVIGNYILLLLLLPLVDIVIFHSCFFLFVTRKEKMKKKNKHNCIVFCLLDCFFSLLARFLINFRGKPLESGQNCFVFYSICFQIKHFFLLFCASLFFWLDAIKEIFLEFSVDFAVFIANFYLEFDLILFPGIL